MANGGGLAWQARQAWCLQETEKSQAKTRTGAEADGYVMAFVHNPGRGAANLVILAAQDFRGEPAAAVEESLCLE